MQDALKREKSGRKVNLDKRHTETCFKVCYTVLANKSIRNRDCLAARKRRKRRIYRKDTDCLVDEDGAKAEEDVIRAHARICLSMISSAAYRCGAGTITFVFSKEKLFRPNWVILAKMAVK